MKKYLAIALALCLSVACLAGCTNQDDKPSDESTPPAVSENVEETTPDVSEDVDETTPDDGTDVTPETTPDAGEDAVTEGGETQDDAAVVDNEKPDAAGSDGAVAEDSVTETPEA